MTTEQLEEIVEKMVKVPDVQEEFFKKFIPDIDYRKCKDYVILVGDDIYDVIGHFDWVLLDSYLHYPQMYAFKKKAGREENWII